MGKRRLRQVTVKHLTGGDAAGRTAVLVATAAVGSSFARGLMPRRVADQAILTGVVGATEYGLVLASQSLAAAVTEALAGGRDAGRPRSGVRTVSTVALVGTGATVSRLLTPRAGEPLRRAVARTAAQRLVGVGAARLFVDAVDAAAGVAVRRGHTGPTVRVAVAGGARLVGVGIATWRIRNAYSTHDPGLLPPAIDPLAGDSADQTGTGVVEVDPRPPVAASLALGAAVAITLEAIALADTRLAHGVAAAARRALPASGPEAAILGRAVSLAAVGGLLVAGVRFANRRAEFFGAGVEAAYAARPASETVSGGPSSSIEWSTLSREGVRFVNMAMTRQEIAEATAAPLEEISLPIRAYAGLASAPTVDARVDLVMADLERLGAFQRSVICLVSPTGSGYANYVAIETLEYLTRGDCATVALQYSLRPSFLSMDRVSVGREQNRALLHALKWRLAAIPHGQRPRLVALGESLGAQTLQDAFLNEGTGGLHRAGVDRALFLGTPATSKWARQWRAAPILQDPAGEIVEVASYDDWMTAGRHDRDRHRYVLLSHPEDPVTRFEAALLVQEPDWLGPAAQRPPGVPQLTRWYPVTTFFATGVDMLNAVNVVPGTFVARGHDYRADLARMVSAAFALPVSDEDLARIEHVLRRREAGWAARRALAEQLARAKEAAWRVACACGLAPADSPSAAVAA